MHNLPQDLSCMESVFHKQDLGEGLLQWQLAAGYHHTLCELYNLLKHLDTME